jgi:hypothetical protein
MGETSSLVSSFSNTDAKKTLVKITTIDHALERHNLDKIDFLKIDAVPAEKITKVLPAEKIKLFPAQVIDAEIAEKIDTVFLIRWDPIKDILNLRMNILKICSNLNMA